METPKTFKEFITEQSKAMYGDWTPSKDRVAVQSIRSLKSDWVQIDKVVIQTEEYYIYKYKDLYTYMLGNFESEPMESDFIVLFQIDLKHRPDFERSLKKYKNIYNVDGVIVKKTSRGKGLAKFMYQYLVNKEKLTIIGDEEQYHKARLLWAKLSTLSNTIVDLVNIETGEVIQKDIKLKHGEADYDFDDRLWSYTDEMNDIRPILKEVK